jgi:hypothetical protein
MLATHGVNRETYMSKRTVIAITILLSFLGGVSVSSAEED